MRMANEVRMKLICFALFYSVAAVFMTTSVQAGKITFSDKVSDQTATRWQMCAIHIQFMSSWQNSKMSFFDRQRAVHVDEGVDSL